jgi:hypothetical protein
MRAGMEPTKVDSIDASPVTEHKLEQVSRLVNDVLATFQEANPEMTSDLLMRNLAIDIGVWISAVHKHRFRAQRYETLRIYQRCMEAGMEAGVKLWDQPLTSGGK